MRRRLFIVAAVAVLPLAIMPSAFAAQQGQSSAPVSVTLASIGTRTIADTGSLLTMTSAAGQTTLSANYQIGVVETSVTGANPWNVTGQLQDTQSTPVPNQVAQVATPSKTIPGASFNVAANSPTPLVTAPAGVTPSAGAGGPLSAAVNLFQVAESTSAVYTNTWTGTGSITLTPPNGTATGTYAGTFLETLFY
jgi:hypothetical protein